VEVDEYTAMLGYVIEPVASCSNDEDMPVL
jgi:hypothetical protein